MKHRHTYLYAIGGSLQPPYNGPCKVIQRGEKTYTIKISNNNVVVSIDRLKPAFLLDDNIEHHSIENRDVMIPLGIQTKQSESQESDNNRNTTNKYVRRSGRRVRCTDRFQAGFG